MMRFHLRFTPRMAWALSCTVLSVGVVCVPAFRLAAATSQQVNDAIEKAQKYLLGQQKNGNWEQVPQPEAGGQPNSTQAGQWGGRTAIATYALLASGQDAQSEPMQQAVRFLGNARMNGVYAVGLRAQVWTYLHPSKDLEAAVARDGKILEGAMRTIPPARGMFHYLPGTTADYDHSASQFGILGMWACAQMGFPTPRTFWALADKGWRDHQEKNGGWAYITNASGDNSSARTVRPSMTAAGVATLFITQDYLYGEQFATPRGNVEDRAIEAGLAWMGEHAKEAIGSSDYTYYTLYGIERIGVAAGRKYLGTLDWFETGAEYLVKHQNEDGSWGNDRDAKDANSGNIPNTSFALLFLARGRAPIMMNKLAYGEKAKPSPAAWNERPRDLANLLRWVGGQIEVDLNWQFTTINAPIDDLDDAPIMLISGDKPLSFTAEEQAKLKAFVESGGIILGNADGGAKGFSESFIELGEALFPPYKFAELASDHVIYSEQYTREKWRNKPSIHALGNGARVFMLIAPQLDFCRFWQTRAVQGHEEAFQFADNLFLYSVDKQGYRYRGESTTQEPNPKIKNPRTISVARLSYDGNWNPEPGGWRQLAAVFHNHYKADLDVQAVPLGEGKLDAKKFRVAHLTGTGPLALIDAARTELKQFTAAGGTLIVDSAGGSGEFTSAAETALAADFPALADKAAATLPPEHKLFSAATGKPTPIVYRRYARKTLGTLSSPRLRAAEVDKKLRVFFSPEDLSVGLVGQPVDGIVGYAPETASEMMADIILYTNPAPGRATTASTTKPAPTPKATVAQPAE